MVPGQFPDLSRLEQAICSRNGKREGRETRFACPAHDDEHPSARWNPDKMTWFCDACKTGGGARDLAARLGVSADRQSPAALPPSATPYRYEDESGELLFEVVRIPALGQAPKSFRQRRPDGKGGWIYKLDGTPRVLFRLPQVRQAVAEGYPIWIVEGEKDVLTAERLDFVATTNPGGAGAWRPEYSEALRGASVVLVPDNDEPGRQHVRKVAQSLQGIAREIRILEIPNLPPKGDLSFFVDYHRAQGTSLQAIGDELERLAEKVPALEQASRPQVPPLLVQKLSEVEAEEVSFLWQPYIPTRKLTILEGDPGQGKSWLVAAIAASGSLGRGLPGMGEFPPFTSLIFTVEDGLADTLRPRLNSIGADCDKIFACVEPIDLSSEEDLKRMEQAIVNFRPRLVVLDPIVSYVGPKTDTHRANQVRAILAKLAMLAESYDCAVLIVRHLSKAKGSRDIYAGQGSIDFTAAARSVLLAGSAADDPRTRALIHLKSNLAAQGGSLSYELIEGRFLWAGESALTAQDLFAAPSQDRDGSAEEEAQGFLLETLASGPVPSREIFKEARELGISERTLRRARSKLRINVRKQGFGGAGGWVWSLPEASSEVLPPF